jgi:hypothetical protein
LLSGGVLPLNGNILTKRNKKWNQNWINLANGNWLRLLPCIQKLSVMSVGEICIGTWTKKLTFDNLC